MRLLLKKDKLKILTQKSKGIMIKKLALLMILMVGKQTLSSQTQNSYPSGSIILDRNKKIEIAKIITNERLLRGEVKLLKSKITELEDVVKGKNKVITTLEDKASTLEKMNKDHEVLESILKDKVKSTEDNVKASQKASSNGLYLWSTLGSSIITDTDGRKTGGIGLGIVKYNALLGVGVNPLNPKLEVVVTLGVKLFKL
nr:MAG TPA: hypothetical protein [Caudoviricetes sp.]